MKGQKGKAAREGRCPRSAVISGEKVQGRGKKNHYSASHCDQRELVCKRHHSAFLFPATLCYASRSSVSPASKKGGSGVGD